MATIPVRRVCQRLAVALPEWLQALQRGDTSAALAAFAAQDLVASVADGVVRGPVWLLQGRIAAARGDRERALRYLRRAASVLRYAAPPWDAVRDSAEAIITRLGAGSVTELR